MKIFGLNFGIGSFGDMYHPPLTLICVEGDGKEIDVPLVLLGLIVFGVVVTVYMVMQP